MTTITESHTAAALLAPVWGADDAGNLSGVHYIAEPTDKGWQHHPVTSVTEAVSKALAISNAGSNVYFACAEYIAPDNRKAVNVRQVQAFWLDIDCGEGKAAAGDGYTTKGAGFEALGKFSATVGLPAPSIVDSGNGLHVYWVLDVPVSDDEWAPTAKKLKALTKKHGLLADPSRTSDLASVLRIPGTMNWKIPANPKPVKLKRMTGAVSFAKFKAAIEAAAPDEVKSVGMNAALSGGLDKNLLQPPPETPENIARVRSMLAAIPADCSREVWRDLVWAVLSTGWVGAVDLAREWSMGRISA